MARYVAGANPRVNIPVVSNPSSKQGKPTNSFKWDVTLNVSEFAKQLRVLGGFNAALCTTLTEFADFPTKTGLFTAIMARNTIVEILNTMHDGSRSWSSGSTVYTDWKDKWGLGQGAWNLTGAVGNSLVARRTGKGYDVGLDRRKRVPRLSYGRQADGPSKGYKMKIEEYASYMEFGTDNMDARPLFAPSFTRVIMRDLPKMKEVVMDCLKATTKIYGRLKITGRKGAQNVEKGSIIGAYSRGSTEARSAYADATKNVEYQQLQDQDIELRCALGESGDGDKLRIDDDEWAGRKIKAEMKQNSKAALLQTRSAEDLQKAMDGLTPEMRAELAKFGY